MIKKEIPLELTKKICLLIGIEQAMRLVLIGKKI
ncbi:MAG: hypothetical protein ACD_39C00758G0004 [uncultured bacterium]|nr:MAG: hypothetical protein ACD_39C00758G0004 [uncultured bacterium]